MLFPSVFGHFIPISSDSEDLHPLHPRPGHHDLLRRSDSESHPDAQRRVWAPNGPGVLLRQPAAPTGDGRCGDRITQRHLPALRRYSTWFPRNMKLNNKWGALVFHIEMMCSIVGVYRFVFCVLYSLQMCNTACCCVSQCVLRVCRPSGSGGVR